MSCPVWMLSLVPLAPLFNTWLQHFNLFLWLCFGSGDVLLRSVKIRALWSDLIKRDFAVDSFLKCSQSADVAQTNHRWPSIHHKYMLVTLLPSVNVALHLCSTQHSKSDAHGSHTLCWKVMWERLNHMWPLGNVTFCLPPPPPPWVWPFLFCNKCHTMWNLTHIRMQCKKNKRRFNLMMIRSSSECTLCEDTLKSNCHSHYKANLWGFKKKDKPFKIDLMDITIIYLL